MLLRDEISCELQSRKSPGNYGWLVAGGWLYQEADSLAAEDVTFTPVSEAQPTPQQLEDLKFAWRLVKHVKSNAITVAKDGRLLGMGSGQPNRVKSVDIALEKAGTDVQVRCCLSSYTDSWLCDKTAGRGPGNARPSHCLNCKHLCGRFARWSNRAGQFTSLGHSSLQRHYPHGF